MGLRSGTGEVRGEVRGEPGGRLARGGATRKRGVGGANRGGTPRNRAEEGENAAGVGLGGKGSAGRLPGGRLGGADHAGRTRGGFVVEAPGDGIPRADGGEGAATGRNRLGDLSRPPGTGRVPSAAKGDRRTRRTEDKGREGGDGVFKGEGSKDIRRRAMARNKRAENFPTSLIIVEGGRAAVGREGAGKGDANDNGQVVGPKIFTHGPGAPGGQGGRGKGEVRGGTGARRRVKISGRERVVKHRVRGVRKPRKEGVPRGVRETRGRVPGGVVSIEVTKDEKVRIRRKQRGGKTNKSGVLGRRPNRRGVEVKESESGRTELKRDSQEVRRRVGRRKRGRERRDGMREALPDKGEDPTATQPAGS